MHYPFRIINAHCQETGMKPEYTEDWSRKPEKITPGKGTLPPSDAIVLYGGASDLNNWESQKEGPATWDASDILTVKPKLEGFKQNKALEMYSFILNGARLKN